MRRAKKKAFPWRGMLTVICGVVLVVSGGMVVRDFTRSQGEQAAYQALAQRVRQTETLEVDRQDPDPVPQKEDSRLTAYAQLHQENSDFVGWISIPGTSIDYPVMYTPEEPEFYLRRAFDKSYAVSGSIFLGEGSQPQGDHVILYGHHMNDGSMFADLLEYAQEDFAKEHGIIQYDTLDRLGEYQVVGAFYSRVYTQEEQGVFRYYQYTDLSEESLFQEYVEQVKSASLYDTGVEPEYGGRIITLSTCSDESGNGRFVVVAYQPGEERP